MIADFHNDFLTSGERDLKGLSEKVRAAVCAVYSGGLFAEEVLSLAECFSSSHPDNLFLAFEDVGFADDGHLQRICAFRPVCVSLTWNAANALAGGCMSEQGLSARGKKAAELFSSAGIAIDCAHINRRSFNDLLDTDARLVDSHTCFYGMRAHPRNLIDFQVRSIVDRGGLIGVTLVSDFLGEGEGEAFFRQIDYAVQRFGAKNFCIGTDFWGSNDIPVAYSCYDCFDALVERMLRAGYSVCSIEAILWKNLCDFLYK